jgi:transcriptional regulator with XRE-family HTH domain
MSAGTALRTKRKQMGLTQDALAKELGVTNVTVSRWETEARRIDDELLPMVSERLGIPRDVLRPDLRKLLGAGA